MFTLWRKWIAYPLGWLLVVGVFLALVSWAKGGAGETYPDMESFEGHYTAAIHGDQVRLQVVETITVELFAQRGILRNLVTRYGGRDLGIHGITVEDADGRAVQFQEKQNHDNQDVELRIGDPDKIVSGVQTYVIRYTQDNAMVGTDQYQELYFNVNGTEWPNGFTRVSATLEVDDDLASALAGATACYQGRGGSTERCEITRDGNVFRADVADVEPWENVTLAVGFRPGTVADPLPPYGARSLGWMGIAIMLGVGVVALLLSLLVRALVRDLKRGETGVVTEFTPPEGIEPIVAADFLGRPEKGAAAHLAWLVLNGHATVEGTATMSAPAPDSDRLDNAARRGLLDDLRLTWRDEGLGYQMRRVSEELFGPDGKRTRLDRATNPWRLEAVASVREEIQDARALRHRLHIGPWLLGLGFVAILVLGIVQVGLGLAGLGWWFLGAGVASILLLILAVHLMPTRGRLTAKGRAVRRQLMGLERFVTMSEANRIAWLQNAKDAPRERGLVQLYEELLPWAIVFGAERSWAALVGEQYDRFPDAELPRLGAIPNLGWFGEWDSGSSDYYRDRRRRRGDDSQSFWSSRPDAGEGSLSKGVGEFMDAVGEMSRGSGASDTSYRSSGSGWSGGRSSSSGGGSSGGGSSGGGTGGGGGGRW